MAKEKQDVYVSIDSNVYKFGKSELLKTQMNILTMQKNLDDLKKTKIQTIRKKLALKKLILTLKERINLLEKDIPVPIVPNHLKPKKEKKTKTIKEIHISRRDMIEQELNDIQEKLRRLNG